MILCGVIADRVSRLRVLVHVKAHIHCARGRSTGAGDPGWLRLRGIGQVVAQGIEFVPAGDAPSSLSPKRLSQVSKNQMRSLTPAATAALSVRQIMALNPTVVWGISKAAYRGLTWAQQFPFARARLEGDLVHS